MSLQERAALYQRAVEAWRSCSQRQASENERLVRQSVQLIAGRLRWLGIVDFTGSGE